MDSGQFFVYDESDHLVLSTRGSDEDDPRPVRESTREVYAVPNIPKDCLLGCHITIRGGIDNVPERAERLNCTVAQIFTSSNRQWKIREFRDGEVERFREHSRRLAGPVVAHATYLLNLAKQEQDPWEKSVYTLREEVLRCDQLGIPFLVIHPGSHVGTGEEEGMERIREALDRVHAKTPDVDTRILLETMAGQGSVIPYRFEQLTEIREGVEQPERLGYCLDSCHVHAAGYDLSGDSGYDEVMENVESILGRSQVEVLHLNDSVAEAGSRKDRHEDIGEGTIGLPAFRRFMNDPRWKDVPKILETPVEDDWEQDYGRNLDTLVDLIGS